MRTRYNSPMSEFLVPFLLPIHLAATWAMVGLIWMVQIVHYPLFAHVGRESFDGFHARHLRWTTWVVGPFMLLESASAVALLYATPSWLPRWVLWWDIGGIFLQWLSTAALQVPMHRRLERGWDAKAQRFLVHSNWVRTLTWTARGLLVGWAWTLAY